jgi:hypothetical protein
MAPMVGARTCRRALITRVSGRVRAIICVLRMTYSVIVRYLPRCLCEYLCGVDARCRYLNRTRRGQRQRMAFVFTRGPDRHFPLRSTAGLWRHR